MKVLGKEESINYMTEKSKMNVRGIFRNIELWVPKDALDEWSRVTSISLSS
jgi:hypothetical protein